MTLYVNIIEGVIDSVRDTPFKYPKGITIVTEHDINSSWTYDEGTKEFTAPRPSREGVNAERDDRVRSVMPFNGHRIDVDQESIARINGAVTLASLAVAQGVPLTEPKWADGVNDFKWIDADDAEILMDIQTLMALGKAAGKWEASHIFAARLLKGMDEIPYDYKDDKYWP